MSSEIRNTVNEQIGGLEPLKLVAVTAATTCVINYVWNNYYGEYTFSERMSKMFFYYLKKLPMIKNQIDTQKKEALDDMRTVFMVERDNEEFNLVLPESGRKPKEVLNACKTLDSYGDVDWKGGKVSGTVYHGGDELTKLMEQVFGMFCWSNPLHPDVFPGIRKMEAEVVQMVVNMFNGDSDCCGTMTSGGTESILMAIKSYRDRAREEKGNYQPNIVVPVTAHAAFDKGCHYFGVRIVHVPVDEETGKVCINSVKKAVNSHTIMILGSAPSFPHGIVDDIPELAEIAKAWDCGLHVDCCLGGFLLPFMKDAGFGLDKPFDFTVDGVTSISCDTHKYGYAPKGSSVVLYRNRDIRRYQYHVQPNWPGGIYASPSISGSRPGSVIAGTWAAMIYMGKGGYVECTKQIMVAREKIVSAMKNIDGITVYGDPKVSVIGYTSDKFSIYRHADGMNKRGWNLNLLQYPSSAHICLTVCHAKEGVAEQFIKDAQEVAEELMSEPGVPDSGMGAIYGMAASIPDRSIVCDLAARYIDTVYTAKFN